MRIDALTDEMAEMFDGLEDYPLICDETHSLLEMEAAEEAWDDWARSDFCRAVEARFAEDDYGELDYFIVTMVPKFAAASTTPEVGYGVWEYQIRLRGNSPTRTRYFLFWMNLLEPSLATGPDIAPSSHADGEVVNSDTVSYTVTVPNDPFAVVEINGQPVQPSYSRRTVNFDETRVDVEYTTELALVPGVNSITVTARSDNGTESSVGYSLERIP